MKILPLVGWKGSGALLSIRDWLVGIRATVVNGTFGAYFSAIRETPRIPGYFGAVKADRHAARVGEIRRWSKYEYGKIRHRHAWRIGEIRHYKGLGWEITLTERRINMARCKPNIRSNKCGM